MPSDSNAPAGQERVTADTPVVEAKPTPSQQFRSDLASEGSRELGTSEALPGVFINRPDRPVVDPKSAPASAGAAPTDPGASGVISSAGAASTPEAPAPAPKFRLGDLEWESEDKAVHSIKTLRGMHRSLLEAQTARDKQIITLQQELLKAAGRRAEVPREGASNATPAGQAQAGPAGSQAAVDWEVFQLLEEKHGRAIAQQWYDGEVAARTEQMIESRTKAATAQLEKKFAPALQLAERTQLRQHGRQLLDTMRTFQYADGSTAYPELLEENAAQLAEVRRIWDASGGTEKELLTQRGLHLAIVTYRDVKAQQAKGGGSRSTAAKPPLSEGSIASGVLSVAGERPAQHQMTPPPSNDIADRITRADLRFDEKLGFSRNR